MAEKYDWDLIERLLHEVQNGAGETFAPRKYAEQHAAAKAAEGENTGNLDALKQQATDLEDLLFKRGFIESRPQDEGGVGGNFILTPRGSSLLAMIDRGISGETCTRAVLDEQADALDPDTFDRVSSQPQATPGVI